MGMRVGGAGSSAAMAAWQAQQRNIATSAPTPPPAPAPKAQALATSVGADQQIAALMNALTTGSTFNRMA